MKIRFILFFYLFLFPSTVWASCPGSSKSVDFQIDEKPACYHENSVKTELFLPDGKLFIFSTKKKQCETHIKSIKQYFQNWAMKNCVGGMANAQIDVKKTSPAQIETTEGFCNEQEGYLQANIGILCLQGKKPDFQASKKCQNYIKEMDPISELFSGSLYSGKNRKCEDRFNKLSKLILELKESAKDLNLKYEEIKAQLPVEISEKSSASEKEKAKLETRVSELESLLLKNAGEFGKIQALKEMPKKKRNYLEAELKKLSQKIKEFETRSSELKRQAISLECPFYSPKDKSGFQCKCDNVDSECMAVEAGFVEPISQKMKWQKAVKNPNGLLNSNEKSEENEIPALAPAN